MKKLSIIVSIIMLAAMGCSAQTPKTDEQKTLYALGVHLNSQLSVFDLTAQELKFVQQGMTDAATGKKLVVEPEAKMNDLRELAQSRVQKATEKQKAKSKAFLEKAAAEKGAVKSDSGLVYTEITPGTGESPKATDIVRVHYVGTLVDGKEFDSSVKRGEPAEFPLGQIIPCWAEGVAKMKVGGKAKLVCPSDLAYGDQGRPPVIPGGAALVFEVELLEIKAPAAQAAPSAQPKAAPKPAVKK